jgi:hypothetical protein
MEHDAYKAEPFAKCIGSSCMAWRWGEGERKWESEYVFDVDGKEGRPPSGEGWKRGARSRAALGTPHVSYSREVELGANRRGFCGLAGKVE